VQTITETIVALRQNRFDFEVIVVLDSVPGDQTGSMTHELCAKFAELRLIERPGKRGVGNAVKTGISAAEGDILAIVMADYSECPNDLVKLLRAVAQGYDMAIGDRFGNGKPHNYPFPKYIVNRCYNLLIKLIFAVASFDTTNAFKAYNARILRQINISSKGFEVFAEIPLGVFLRVPRANITSISVKHSVRKKREAKLSLLKEGPRYIRIVASMFFTAKIKKNYQSIDGQ